MSSIHAWKHRTAIGMATLAAIGLAALITAQLPRATASTSPPPIDPEVLYESATTLTTEQMYALMDYLEAASWGIARRATSASEWHFTGLAIPIGAYSANAPIGELAEPAPDGIYLVINGGTLMSEGATYSVADNSLLLIGEVLAGEEKGKNKPCEVRCRSGFYACCGQSPDGNQPLFCRCVPNGQQAQCEIGGHGTKSCSIVDKHYGGACNVTCHDTHYACCYDDPSNNNKPKCVCLPNNQPNPPGIDCGPPGGSEYCARPGTAASFGNTEPPFVEPE